MTFLTVCAGAAALLSSCQSSPERSVSAFCNTFRQEATRLHDKYAQEMNGADSDPLGGLLLAIGGMVQAEGDMAVMFDRLDKVAPGDIEPEVGAMRDAAKQQLDALSHIADDPLEALGAGLFGGLASSGSAQRVNEYLQNNCDLSFES